MAVAIPKRGDIAWADASPTHGKEQYGDRPHLVITNSRFHLAYQLAIVVPATTAGVRGRKVLPTWIPSADGSGHYMVEQVRAMSLERIRRISGSEPDAVPAVVNIMNRLTTEGDP